MEILTEKEKELKRKEIKDGINKNLQHFLHFVKPEDIILSLIYDIILDQFYWKPFVPLKQKPYTNDYNTETKDFFMAKVSDIK